MHLSITNLTPEHIFNISSRWKKEIGDLSNSEVTCQYILTSLFETFVDTQGEKEIALCRFFKSCKRNELPKDIDEYLEKAFPNSYTDKYLALCGTYGTLREWCDRKKSKNYKAFPINNKVVDSLPMMSALFDQIGIRLGELKEIDNKLLLDTDNHDFDVFWVENAKNSQYIPKQESFIIPHKIKSVVGFGGKFSNGNVYAVIIFSKVHISREIAALFKSLAPAIKYLLIETELKGSLFETIGDKSKTIPNETKVLLDIEKEKNISLTEESLHISSALIQSSRKIEKLNYEHKSILSSAGEGIYGLDLNGHTTFANPAAERILGYPLKEMKNISQHDLIHHTKSDGSHYIREDCKIYAALNDGQVHRVADEVFWRKDGTSFPVEYVSTPIKEDGKITGAVVTFSDITERKKIEEELHLKSKAIEQSSTTIVITDFEGDIQYANSSFFELTGYCEAECIGNNMSLVKSGKHSKEFVADYWNTIKSGKTWKGEWCNKKKNGELFWSTAVTSPVMDKNETIIHFVEVKEDITKQKAVEAERRISQERFRTIFEEAPLGVAMIDSLTGEIYEVNPRFAEIAGRTIEEIATIDWMSITHPDDVQEDLKNMADLNAGKINGFNMNKRYIKPDGSHVWINLTVAPISVENKTKPRHLAMIEDITERKEFESELEAYRLNLKKLVDSRTDELNKSKDALTTLISNLNGMVYHCKNDKDWTMDFVSTGSLDLTGYKPEDIENNNVITYNEIIHPDDREMVWKKVQEALKDKEQFVLNYRIRTSEGEVKYVFEQGRGVWLENGELDGLQGFIEDVSELRRKTLELQKSEKKFKSYFEMPLSGIAIFDKEGRWVEANDRMCEIVGYSREELLGFVWVDATYPSDIKPYLELIEEIKNSKRDNYSAEKRYARKDGIINFVEAFVGCVRDKGGDAEYYVALVQDISVRKKAEEDRINLDQMKTDFLSTAAHELRTPLTSIRGFSELMKTKDNLSADMYKKYSESINEESETLANIIDDLLDISKIEAKESFSLSMKLSNLINCVNQEVSFFGREDRGHKFPIEILGDPCDVLMDSEKVQHILKNLYSNSIKYSESGCEITTLIEFREDVVLVSVSDTGKGMTSGQVEQIFDKFYRADEVKNIQGTGLGMSIVKHLVEAHAGRVWVESEIDKGTTVSFELPRFSPIWRREFSVNVASLDNQHKELFALTGKLAKSIRNNEGEKSTNLILNELVKYAEFHFKYEEDFFHKYNYPDAENHIKFHRSFENKVTGFKFISESDKQHLPHRVVSFLYEWLTAHILKEDMGYSSFLISKGVNEKNKGE